MAHFVKERLPSALHSTKHPSTAEVKYCALADRDLPLAGVAMTAVPVASSMNIFTETVVPPAGAKSSVTVRVTPLGIYIPALDE